ncbi:Uncharacterised protein [Turicibacter sanguinis]|nr:Uncharacterised protein [Turicibacter sanguinis]
MLNKKEGYTCHYLALCTIMNIEITQFLLNDN